jgi:DNA-directed RNA polymerase subunit H (RpoH/RPB5)
VKRCAVFYVFPAKIETDPKKQSQVLSKELKPIMLIVKDLEPEEMILITPGAIKTTYTEQLNDNKQFKKTKTYIFNEKSFLFDLTHHILQPVRCKRIIPIDENDPESVDDAKMLKDRKIDLMKLPVVAFNDPYAKYFGFSVGDIIKLEERIDYLNLISETQISYVRIGPYRNFEVQNKSKKS